MIKTKKGCKWYENDTNDTKMIWMIPKWYEWYQNDTKWYEWYMEWYEWYMKWYEWYENDTNEMKMIP